MSELRIELFGPMRVTVAGRPPGKMRSRKGQWLLALLTLRANREIERPWLSGTLWPESEERQALYNLRENLSELRRAMGPAADRLTSPTQHTLFFDLQEQEADVLQFDRLVACTGEESLRQSDALYRGPLLEGCLEEWAGLERERRAVSWAAALEKLAELAMARGDYENAAGVLRRLTQAEPLRESASRMLMEALAAGGSQAAASQVFRDLRLLLHRELNAYPDPLTVEAYERIRSEAGRDRLSMALPRASVAGGPSMLAPALPAPNLPVPLTPLIGREREIAEVKGMLTDGRLVTLMGPGGIGKTRLAIGTAEVASQEMPDGAWWVDLAQFTDPALVPFAAASVFGISQDGVKPVVQSLAAFLRDRRALLVFDNCEHLVEASARLAGTLLERCPNVRILATSRERLGVTGERTYRTPSLSLPDLPVPGDALSQSVSAGKDWLPYLMEYDGIRLFADRAADVNPDFRLTRDNGPLVVEIVRRLDGIALAIELAAARLRFFSLEEIGRRLSDRLQLLSSGSRAAMPRHQTLRALIDWSYDLLGPAERTLLDRLSVFQGGWTLDAAETVCDDSDEMLGSLVDKSLVQVKTRGPTVRYSMLESLREYANERLEGSGERDASRARHAEWYLQLAEESHPQMRGAGAASTLERLEEEQPNLRAALEWTLETRPEWALRMAGSLGLFWYYRGRSQEGLGLVRRALEAMPDGGPVQARLRALYSAGLLAYVQSEPANAQASFEEMAVLARESDHPTDLAFARNGLGMLADHRGDYATAISSFEEALEIHRRLGDAARAANAIGNVGHALGRLGRYEEARARLAEALALNRQAEQFQGVAYSLHVIGWTFHRQDIPHRARESYGQALEIFRDRGFRTGELETTFELGELEFSQGNVALGRTLLETALGLSRELQLERWVYIVMSRLGRVRAEIGELDGARDILAAATLYFEEARDAENLSACHVGWAALELHSSDGRNSAVSLGTARALRRGCAEAVHPHNESVWQSVEDRVRALIGEEAFVEAHEVGLHSRQGIPRTEENSDPSVRA